MKLPLLTELLCLLILHHLGAELLHPSEGFWSNLVYLLFYSFILDLRWNRPDSYSLISLPLTQRNCVTLRDLHQLVFGLGSPEAAPDHDTSSTVL